MSKRRTSEEFKKEVYDLVGDEYEILSEYINTTTYIDIKHNICGHIYKVKPYAFLRGNRCPKCSGKLKKNIDIFKKEVYDLAGDEYEVIGDYINSNIPIEIKHVKCGHIYKVSRGNFIKGRRCPKCFGTKKRTHEQFKQEVYNLVGNEYEVIGEYINTDTNIEVKHMVCGHVFQTIPKNFLSGKSRCPVCLNRNKITFEEFKSKFHEIAKNEYEIIGDYIDSNVPIEIKHTSCNHTFKVKPKSFLNGKKCLICSKKEKDVNKDFKKKVYDLFGDEYEIISSDIDDKNYIEVKHTKCNNIYKIKPKKFLKGKSCMNCFNKSKTTERFKEEVYDLVKDKYEVLGDYINEETDIEIKHITCGNIFKVNPSMFLRGERCPKCSDKFKKTEDEFKKEVYNLVGDEYIFLENYIKSSIPIKVKHNKCGYIYEVKPSSFLHGSRCPKCSKKAKKTTKDFKKEVYDLVGDEYIVLSKYINSKTHLKMRHNKCGHIYMVRPDKFLGGNRCPKCNNSRGEMLIAKFLDKHKIKYKHNKSYGNCCYKGSLRFDFLIFDESENLKLIIEFDGIQHFESAKSFGGEETFKEIQIRDNIKNEFCKENNIHLLRIPYWEIDNIDRILSEELYKLRLIKK